MNKYKAKMIIRDGIRYASIKEADDALWLESLRMSGKIMTYMPQFRVNITVNKTKIGFHKVDFKVILPDGRAKFMETKGFRTSLWVWKMKLTKALYPNIEYLVNPSVEELLK